MCGTGPWWSQESSGELPYTWDLVLVAQSCLFATVARQAPLSTEFPRQECWSGLPFPTPGNLPDPRTEPASPALAGGFWEAHPRAYALPRGDAGHLANPCCCERGRTQCYQIFRCWENPEVWLVVFQLLNFWNTVQSELSVCELWFCLLIITIFQCLVKHLTGDISINLAN